MGLNDALNENFIRLYGRQPTALDLADMTLALALELYYENVGLNAREIQARVTQMLMPGSELRKAHPY